MAWRVRPELWQVHRGAGGGGKMLYTMPRRGSPCDPSAESL
jgi:hypothetical protein